MFTPFGGLIRPVFYSLVLGWLASASAAQAPVAEFEGSPTSGSAPLFVNFTDLSSGSVTSWVWNFGDMGGALVQDPLYAYINSGTYTVSLTVSGPGGSDTETKSAYISVLGPPEVDFTAAPVNGLAPLQVSFSDTSTPAVSSWSWSFGDGGTSSLQNPTHTYTTPGVYTVSLTATGPGGSDTETKADLISVTQIAGSVYRNGGGNPPGYVAPPPIIGGTWTAEVDSSLLPNALVTLILVRSEPADGPNTIFGRVLVNPGSLNFNTSIQPASGGIDLHSFRLPNTPSLIGRPGYSQGAVIGPMNTGLFYNAADLVPGVQPAIAPPVVGFNATPVSGDVPLAVSFTDESTGTVSAWNWDFGDGTTSTAENPTHVYAEGGSFAVSLVVEGPGGYDAEYRADHIVVSDPVAGFSGMPTSGVLPLSVSFADESVGTVSSWSWDFGDGGTSTAQNPTHLYTLEGLYTVSLTATGPHGSSTEIKTDYVSVVANAPVAEFIGAPLTGEPPVTVSFTNLSTGTVTSWSWDFGDGGMATVPNPSHVYTLPGTYTVSLVANGPGGSDTEVKTDYVTVALPPPLANFGASTPTSGVIPLTVDFRDQSSGTVSSWSWDFGDGGMSTDINPQHTYIAAGTYSVSLTVSGPTGSTTETKPDFVVVAPQLPFAFFEGLPPSGEVPLVVAFSDLSIGPISSWFWDFGDGNTSTLQNPTHVYAAVGTYTVTLSIGSSLGPDTRIEPNYITTKPGPFSDGGFEAQSAGMAPGAPWLTSGGSGHLVQPDGGILLDNGFPYDGVQWAEVSAAGSSGALPPTNPGGGGSLPQGAHGIVQPFAYVPETPVLVFGAAFLLGDAASSAATNDFMSVDVSFGASTHNLYYADTFSDFPATSARHGLPMTVTQAVGTNLATLFPLAIPGSTFILSIQVGNGGDGADSSLGFVDGFEMRSAASVTYRNGNGINPPCFVAPPPAVGSMWTPSIDHRDQPGATFAVVLLRMGSIPPLPTVLGELLVNSNVIFNLVAPADGSGVTGFSTPIASNPALFISASAQGLIVGTPAPRFCNALDVQVGLAPTDPVPQAAFVVSATVGPAPLAVVFADTSVGPVTSWNWDFGDGSTSTQQHPPHTYVAPGIYTVHLRTTGPGGLDIERKFDLMQVTP